MCGIAGYSLNRESSIDRTLTAQALLAAIAERGADAVGLWLAAAIALAFAAWAWTRARSGRGRSWLVLALLAAGVVGGYVVTDRMLQMFRRKPTAPKAEAAAPTAAGESPKA